MAAAGASHFHANRSTALSPLAITDASNWSEPMKLYDFTSAPNPRRVRIFLAEKGVTVPLEQVDLFQGANRSSEALKRNP